MLIVVLTIGIFPGCGGDPEDCERTVPLYFDVFGIELAHASGNAFSFQILPSGSSLLFENYRGIHILPNVNLYGLAEPKKPSLFKQLFQSNSLWAGDFIPGSGGSETEILSNIEVTTINEFSDQYPAGSNIDEIIEVWQGENLIPLADFLASKSESLLQLEDLPYVLRPSIKPPSDVAFEVIIEITFTNGENYSARSGSLNILD